ncbi:hypothetical protein, partial [Aliiruegeria lutimaris]|uniref:hypothetical protein n=1 Tax=Aliiruegeria lutimaris TaxID=571298 RepID=UPI001BB09257
GETALPHSNLLGSRHEKILQSHPVNHGEDYPIIAETSSQLRRLNQRSWPKTTGVFQRNKPKADTCQTSSGL